MSLKDSYGFTIDVANFVRICLSDPSTKEMVYDAIRKGPMDHTTPLGAANMKEEKEDPDAWYTAFLGTSNQIKAGEEGFVLRNSSGQGPRVSIRLKRQTPKTHTAQTPGEVLPAVQAESSQDLLARALRGDPEAAAAILKLAASAQQPSSDEDTITITL